MSTRVPDFWPFSSDYYHTSGRAGQVRLVHIKAPAEAFPRRRPSDCLAFCGIGAYDVTNSPKISHSPDAQLPPGLRWCPKCLGVAAFHLGAGSEVERIVIAHLSHLLRSIPTAAELLALTERTT